MVESLENLGLGEYESKVYLALVRFGPMSAKRISETSGVPKNRVYGTVSSLERKGFVGIIFGKPQTFKAIDPKVILEERIKSLEDIGKELSGVYQRQEGLEERETFLLLRGYKNAVRLRVREFGNIKRDCCLIVGRDVTTKKLAMIEREIKATIKRGVRIRILRDLQSEEEMRKAKSELSLGVEVKNYPWEGFTVHILDKKMVWLEFPDKRFERTAIRIENKRFAMAMYDYFNRIWKDAEAVK